MKAMIIKQYGEPEVFEPGVIETPKINDYEILVKVYGSSVNPVDTGIRRGLLKYFVRLKLPAILGVDVSGEVVMVGRNVTKFEIGNKVYAFLGISKNGGYGEFVSIPESFAALVPDNLNLTEAGTAPGVGMTAYEAFTVHAPVKKGMKVLINGATGGVGTYAIQVAKYFGAEVTAVCSTEKVDLAKKLGADKIIDYKKQNIVESGKKFDIIINCARGIGFNKFRKLLESGGKSIVIAGSPIEMPLIKLTNLFSSRKTIPFFVKTDGAILEGLSTLIKSEKVRPVIQKMYPWNELPQAHRDVESGKIAGKIGISIIVDKDSLDKIDSLGLTPTQIAWVVKDVEKSKTFFQEMFGVKNFMPTGTTRLQDYDGTYYGKLVDAENLVTMTYSGGTFIEIIQPISGKSIFKDYIDNNPTGGIQHIAYSTPIANLDNVISEFEDKGFKKVSSFNTPIAKIVFFDTREEIGVFTEIMGITKEGEKAVHEMKIGLGQG